jgi:hypothetical protein
MRKKIVDSSTAAMRLGDGEKYRHTAFTRDVYDPPDIEKAGDDPCKEKNP